MGFLSCTKMLYMAEKLLRNGYYEIPDSESFARQLGMKEKEIEDIFDQFEHGGLFRWGLLRIFMTRNIKSITTGSNS